MKIGFDVSDLCTNRADGTTRYTWELAGRLPLLGENHQWSFFAPCEQQMTNDQCPVTNWRWHASPWPKYWTQTRLPADLYRHRLDVLFMPIQQIPYVRPKKTKTVAVVHDLAVHRYPECFTYKDWLLLHVFSAYAVREAKRIIAVSRATADDIARYYGRTEGVHVVHHGVDHEQFRLPTKEERTAGWQKLTTAYLSLTKPYILFVGQIQPRKNLIRLVEAFETLGSHQRELRLVIAGSHGWLQQPIYERIGRSVLKGRIILPGRVPDELLPALYWHAEVFVLPSLYEGFCMPVLEAMACGCAVVASNVSSLPEVAGDAAVLVDPVRVSSIVSGIQRALEQRDELVQRGCVRAKHFTWEKTVQHTLRVLAFS